MTEFRLKPRIAGAAVVSRSGVRLNVHHNLPLVADEGGVREECGGSRTGKQACG